MDRERHDNGNRTTGLDFPFVLVLEQITSVYPVVHCQYSEPSTVSKMITQNEHEAYWRAGGAEV